MHEGSDPGLPHRGRHHADQAEKVSDVSSSPLLQAGAWGVILGFPPLAGPARRFSGGHPMRHVGDGRKTHRVGRAVR